MFQQKSESKSKRALKALIKTVKDHAIKLIIAALTCAVDILTGGKAMAEKIGQFFSTYGLAGSIIIILVIVFTQLLKLPIKKFAVKWAEANGYDEEGKKRITQWVALIPFVLAFILSFLYVIWFDAKWNVNAIDWFDVGKYTVSYATIAIATFDVVKGFVQAYALKKNQTPTATVKQQEGEVNPPEAVESEDERQAREKAQAEADEAKRLAEAEKAKKEAEKIRAKKLKKYNVLMKKIGKAQKEIEGLDIDPNDLPGETVEAEEVVNPEENPDEPLNN